MVFSKSYLIERALISLDEMQFPAHNDLIDVPEDDDVDAPQDGNDTKT